MNLMENFELAGGTIMGRDHRLCQKNAQDDFTVIQAQQFLVGVVCDGCGSGDHSEVGSKIGSRIVANQLSDLALRMPGIFSPLYQARALLTLKNSILLELDRVVRTMGLDYAAAVEDYFLFTIIAFVMTPEDTFILSAGDGVVFVNCGRFDIEPDPGNKPRYLSYGLLRQDFRESQLLRSVTEAKTADIESILLGTDGTLDLIAAEKKLIPGKDEAVGPISQFWENDSFFKNPWSIQRRLALASRTVTRMDPEDGKVIEQPGYLRDDTTVLVLRKKAAKA